VKAQDFGAEDLRRKKVAEMIKSKEHLTNEGFEQIPAPAPSKGVARPAEQSRAEQSRAENE